MVAVRGVLKYISTGKSLQAFLKTAYGSALRPALEIIRAAAR
jgi:hypothetical protein